MIDHVIVESWMYNDSYACSSSKQVFWGCPYRTLVGIKMGVNVLQRQAGITW